MKLITLVILLLITPASAQQAMTPEVQALQAKLMQELSSGLQCTTQAIALQQQVSKLEAEIKTLKENKPDAKQKP